MTVILRTQAAWPVRVALPERLQILAHAPAKSRQEAVRIAYPPSILSHDTRLVGASV